MAGASDNYFSAYAVFLRATTTQIAALASVPPLLASLCQLLGVWLGQKTGLRKVIIVRGALLQVLALGAVAVLPLLCPSAAFDALLVASSVYFIGAHLGTPLWGSLMGSIVPGVLRGRFFATRTRLSSVASFITLILAGLILQLFDSLSWTYIGFLVIFAIGSACRLISAWHLQQMHDPPQPYAVEGERVNAFSLEFVKGQGRLLRFSLFYAAMQFAVSISSPFMVVYLLTVLKFSYFQLTINTAAFMVVQFMVLNRWGRLADLFGNGIILRLTGFTIPVIPVLWVLSTDYWYLLMLQALSGLLWSGFTLSASNFVFDLTSERKRAGLMAIHNIISGLAIFVGAFLGGYLALHLPVSVSFGEHEIRWLTAFYDLFILSGVLRLLVALAFLPRLEEVRSVRKMNYTGLIFRVIRFSPVSGMIFDIVGKKSGD